MPTIHLIHGFNVRDGGRGTIAKLGPYAESAGFEQRLFSYGWLGLMGVWFLNPRIVKQLIHRIMPGDIGIAHSNGCVLLLMAAIRGAPFKLLIYVNPALNSNAPPPPVYVEAIHVYHNDGDLVVKLAAWLWALAPWAPLGDPLWGDMGARGYQPGAYADANYKPTGRLNRLIHALNITCVQAPILLQLLRVFIGIPIALLYWFILAPVEVALTFFFNNVIGKEQDMSLTVRRQEDRKFIVFALVVPLLFWIAVVTVL